jgi:hypothetical protein
VTLALTLKMMLEPLPEAVLLLLAVPLEEELPLPEVVLGAVAVVPVGAVVANLMGSLD